MADSLAEHRRAVEAEGSRERHTVEEEDSLGAGSRSEEGIGDATLVVAVVVVDCSLEPGMENVSGVVGADCNQAEGCNFVGMVAGVRLGAVGRSTTWLTGCRGIWREGCIGTVATRRIAGKGSEICESGEGR